MGSLYSVFQPRRGMSGRGQNQFTQTFGNLEGEWEKDKFQFISFKIRLNENKEHGNDGDLKTQR